MTATAVFKPTARFIVSIGLAVMAAVVYRGYVFSHFAPIRLDVVATELHSSRHVITVALPDLSAVRGQSGVLAFHLRNDRSDERRVGISLGGSTLRRGVLPPNRTTDWTVVLSPDLIRSLMATGRQTPATIELTGDADGWMLTAVQLRNYHARLGDSLIVIVPDEAQGYRKATAVPLMAIALCVLGLVAALPCKPYRRSIHSISSGLTLTALVVSLSCLLVPSMSPYKVLISFGTFLLIAAALFSSALLNVVRAAPTIVVTAPSRIRRGLTLGARFWTRHETTLERAAALVGLVAIAIAQPIFDVLSNSPEFFAARGTLPKTAITAVLVICFALPLGLVAIERAIRSFSRRTASMFFGVVVALLSAAIVLPSLRRGDLLSWPWDLTAGALAGAAAAIAYARARLVRQFLVALAPAGFIVPTLFLLHPDVKRNFLPSQSVAAVETIERTPPIVFVIFDELPVNSLLNARAEIDAERYPNFAALARDAYWFRSASTVAATTSYAVPAILSGRYPSTLGAVPTLRYYPVNLFTTLARHYNISASLRFQLCPARACQNNSGSIGDTVPLLLSDLGLVWLHIVLPQKLTQGLPPVTDDWAEFGAHRETSGGEQGATRGDAFAEFLSSIDGRPARLDFIHSLLPHMPFEYVPSGQRYGGPHYQIHRYGSTALFEGMSASYAETLQQRHLAQLGFVDRLLGDLIARLRTLGAYDRTLIIITADHGSSYREDRARHSPQPNRNLSDILRVPLFLKLPGQQHGEVVDRIVETVDIFPTVLDVVGANTALATDGRSLFDLQAPDRSSSTYFTRNPRRVTARRARDLSADRTESLARKDRRFGSGDLRKTLYAPPALRHLLGVNVSNRAALSKASDVQIAIDRARLFEEVTFSRGLPLYVSGDLSTSRSDPLTVAVAVNGAVAAITHSYRVHDRHMFGTLIPETSLRPGNNSVTAFVLDTASSPPRTDP